MNNEYKYPLISEYNGGGSIFNKYTSSNNLKTWCPHNIRNEVINLIKNGYEVIILNDKIMAASIYNY